MHTLILLPGAAHPPTNPFQTHTLQRRDRSPPAPHQGDSKRWTLQQIEALVEGVEREGLGAWRVIVEVGSCPGVARARSLDDEHPDQAPPLSSCHTHAKHEQTNRTTHALP